MRQRVHLLRRTLLAATYVLFVRATELRRPSLPKVQHLLEVARHQLAQAAQQLAHAVHQVTRAGSLQAAQRATDSHDLLVNSGIALGLVTVLALLAAWLVAGRILAPIRTITRRA